MHKIKNLSNTTSFNIKVNDTIPELPFNIALVGPSKSGKSNLIKNLLLRNDMYKDIFEKDSIFIFSPSLDLNDDFDDVKTKYKFNSFDKNKLKKIITKQENIVKNYGKKRTKHILIIFDDCFDSPEFAHSPLLQRLAMRGRHALISTILSGQKASSIPRGARLNLTHLMVFRPSNLSELDFILDEYVDKSKKKDAVKIFKEIFTEPYSFIYFDNLNKDYKKRVRNGFVKPIEGIYF